MPSIARMVTLVAVIAGCSAPARPSEKQVEAERDAVARQVDALVARHLRQGYAPGIAVSVVRGGRDTLVLRGYGLADAERRIAVTPATLFPIASVSKQFTAAAVLRLVDEKRIALDDPIGRHIRGLPAAWRPVLVRQLLNHTSGFPQGSPSLRRPIAAGAPLSPDSVVALLRGQPLEFAPGARFVYDNMGYVLLALLVEKASGQPYEQYLRSTLLRPNGITATRACAGEPPTPARAVGYALHDTLVHAPNALARITPGAGALCSTVGDLAAWNHAMATGRVLSAASRAAMTQPEGAARDRRYGYGVSVRSIAGHPAVSHGGRMEGFASLNAYLPADSLSVTVLSNLGTDDLGELFTDIIRAAARPSPSGTRRSAEAARR